ncbi:uncharacterized protein LOC121736150 [Aricia agestis]|uniref:uncharacterized protein LOC121736150 n=1 Tax=Aricia agestis TaxID=91739 RepID=UPI001C2075EA|nr:uncharacterized protein LOC121736150 [Aricia agestis]
MGIKEDLDMDSEPTTPSERKKYIVVKNHVREIQSIKTDETTTETSAEEKDNSTKEVKVKKKKSKKSRSSSGSENSACEISVNDLNELRSVYSKCKAVIKKIETKYGHLLQTDEQSCSRISKHRLSSTECHCGSKRKIVYDDDGKQLYQNIDAEHHICPENVLNPTKSMHRSPGPLNVTMEDETSYELPDTISELNEMLREKQISNYLKHQIMQKMKYIREDHINILRYEKPSIIEKLKSNSSDIFEFEGSNLSSLPGYPEDKIS